MSKESLATAITLMFLLIYPIFIMVKRYKNSKDSFEKKGYLYIVLSFVIVQLGILYSGLFIGDLILIFGFIFIAIGLLYLKKTLSKLKFIPLIICVVIFVIILLIDLF